MNYSKLIWNDLFYQLREWFRIFSKIISIKNQLWIIQLLCILILSIYPHITTKIRYPRCFQIKITESVLQNLGQDCPAGKKI